MLVETMLVGNPVYSSKIEDVINSSFHMHNFLKYNNKNLEFRILLLWAPLNSSNMQLW